MMSEPARESQRGAAPSGLTSDERQRGARREDGASKGPGGEQGPEGPLLDVRDLVVHHGQLRALDAISLRVFPGEVYAIIGANGAG